MTMVVPREVSAICELRKIRGVWMEARLLVLVSSRTTYSEFVHVRCTRCNL